MKTPFSSPAFERLKAELAPKGIELDRYLDAQDFHRMIRDSRPKLPPTAMLVSEPECSKGKRRLECHSPEDIRVVQNISGKPHTIHTFALRKEERWPGLTAARLLLKGMGYTE